VQQAVAKTCRLAVGRCWRHITATIYFPFPIPLLLPQGPPLACILLECLDCLSQRGGQSCNACRLPLCIGEGPRVQGDRRRQAQLLLHAQQARHCRQGRRRARTQSLNSQVLLAM
jgi:hypothetical protein